VLILTPTRELAIQVAAVAKALCHKEKFSVLALVGGKKEGLQRQALEKKRVDLVVATTGRLVKAMQGGWCHLTDVRACVIDEIDTMLCAGEGRVGKYGDFDTELLVILKALGVSGEVESSRGERNPSPSPPPSANKLPRSFSPARPSVGTHLLKQEVGASSPVARDEEMLAELRRDPVQFLLAGATIPPQASRAISRLFPYLQRAVLSSAHKARPGTEVEFVRISGADREGKHTALLGRLPELLREETASGGVLIFCNSIPCARSTALTLGEAGWAVASLHGGLPPLLREAEFSLFKQGKCPIMVATDSAARGLDFGGGVGTVVLFDFPKTPTEYLHRIGRTNRGVAQGGEGKTHRVIALLGKYDLPLARAVNAGVGGEIIL